MCLKIFIYSPFKSPRQVLHTFASLLLANDAHPKYVQDQMGHATIKITMDTYSHLLPEAHKKGGDTLNKILAVPKQEEKERRFGT